MKKILLAFLFLMLVPALVLVFVSCNKDPKKGPEKAPECEHQDTDYDWLCDICGAEFEHDTEQEGHTHDFCIPYPSDRYLASAPDCTHAATYYYRCECGKRGTETFTYGDPQHNYTSSTVAPTATEDGYTDYTCPGCNDTYRVTITPVECTLMSYHRKLIGYTGQSGEELVIPAVFQNDGYWYRITEIGNSAFSYCVGLTSVTIPDTVTKINSYAFDECTSLASVNISSNVTEIGDSAFENCKNLTSVTFGKNSRLTKISDYAFQSCSSLESITIPESVTSIGNNAFSWCTNLVSITLNDSLTEIGYYAFYETKLYKNSENWENDVLYIEKHLIYAKESLSGAYTIKPGTLCIANSAFADCRSLTSISIPDSVTGVGYYAFHDCYSLESITVSKNNLHYKSIDGDLYSNDGKTFIRYAPAKTNTTFTIPDSVTKIEDSAFYGSRNLTNVTIGNNVTHIGYSAFYYCRNLKNVTIGSGVTFMGFSGSVVGGNVFYNCRSLESITVDSNNPAYKSIDGNLYSKDGKTLIQYAIGKTAQSFTVPDGVITIGVDAFTYCDYITNIVISDTVTTILEHAFSSCESLTSVTFGSGVTTIDFGTFYSCRNLSSVTFKNTDNWYITDDSFDWQDMTNGVRIDVTNPSKNATFFKSTYYNHYWYKL